jgi:hypothetical protein
VSTQDSVVAKLRAKLAFHEGEARRIRGLLDAIVREIGSEMAAAENPHRFKGLNFISAITKLLRETGPLSAGDITQALLAGGFETTSEQPRRNIANMLDQAAAKKLLRKSGDRTSGVLWSLPDEDVVT